jgi:hypothetical protein
MQNIAWLLSCVSLCLARGIKKYKRKEKGKAKTKGARDYLASLV